MTSIDPTIKEIFFGAIRLPPNEVEAYLGQTCGGNPELRQRVDLLLKAHDASGSDTRFGSSVSIKNPIFSKMALDTIERSGDQIGAYRLIEQIGEGGFGVVFKAQQSEPFRRIVAIKVVKIGMDTRQCLARFESERQTLALMQHPSIAAIYEGGMTANGRPYFVMELVEGIRITDYCTKTGLSFDARLKLFLQVCRAVEHSHQQGILHRDIKPSNVMVVESEGKPLVKVIDFGLAKALDPSNFECSLTRSGDLIGTPMYMSPEQTGLSSSLDTRTDVYSLGMLLYEILADQPPYDRQLFQTAPLESQLKTVRESDPPRLSSHWKNGKFRRPFEFFERLATTPVSEPSQVDSDVQRPPISSLSENGNVSLRRLRREFDWIVRKATEKDRELRYSSVGELIADIVSFRLNQPISAKPYSAAYVIGKFVSRNRTAAFAAVSILLGLVIISAISTRAAWKLAAALQSSETAHRLQQQASLQSQRDSQTALIHLAHAHTRSRQPGQRLDALDSIQSALKLNIDGQDRQQLLRNTAAAALCLPDLKPRPLLTHSITPYDRSLVKISRRMDLVGYLDPQTNQFVVRRLKDAQELMRLPNGHWDLSAFDYRGPSFSPDSRYLVYSKVIDGKPHLHTWVVGQPESGIDWGHQATSLSFAPDMDRCCVTHQDGTIRILSLPDFGEEHCINLNYAYPYGDWSPGGDKLSAWGYETLKVFETSGFNEISHMLAEGDEFDWHCWHPDNQTIASVLRNGKLFTWNSQSGSVERVLQSSSRRRGHLIAFSNCGRFLAMNNWQSMLTVMDYQTTNPVLTAQANGTQLQFSEDGSHLLADAGVDAVSVFQFQPPREAKTITRDAGLPFAAGNISRAVDEDKLWMAVNHDGGISVLDLRSGKVAWELPVWGNRPFRFNRDPYGLWTTGPKGLIFWPIDTQRPYQAMQVGPPVRKVSVETIGFWGSDEAERIFVGSTFPHKAVLVDPANGELKVLEDADIRFCTVSSDGKHAATCTHSHPVEVKLWETQSARFMAKFPLQATSQIAFLPDGRSLITAGNGLQIRSLDDWDNPIRMGPESGAFQLSSDGELLAVASEPQKMSLYDVRNKRLLVQLTAPEDTRLWPLYFSSARDKLYAYGTETGYLYEYDLRLIRAGLSGLGLDWDRAESPASEVRSPSLTSQTTADAHDLPFNTNQVLIDLGEYSAW